MGESPYITCTSTPHDWMAIESARQPLGSSACAREFWVKTLSPTIRAASRTYNCVGKWSLSGLQDALLRSQVVKA